MTAPANSAGATQRITRALSTQAFRLAATTAAGFLLAATIVVAVLFWHTNDLLTENVLSGLQSEASELATHATSNDLDTLIAKIRARSRPDGQNLYFLATRSGDRLAGNLRNPPDGLRTKPNGGVIRYQRSDNPTKMRLAVVIPVKTDTGPVLFVGRDLEDQRNYAARIRATFLYGFGVLAVIAIAAGVLVGQSVLRRIETINATSRQIMAGDFSRRVPVTRHNDELDHVAESLNEMLDRIEQLMGGLREVSDNIAHDLKTPLNRLRNRAEAALRDPRGADAYKDGLEDTIEKADDLIKTFNALLLIARLEAGVVEETAETFDLGALVQDVAELYEPVAEEAGFNLAIDIQDNLIITANRQLVGQAVANLADNAIKYSATSELAPTDKTIRISAHKNPTSAEAEIIVADRGPGIAPEDRDRALRRFVRLEKSRTKPGTGLGLSLVAAVARLHHGNIQLEDNSPGLKVLVRLPTKVHSHETSDGGNPTAT